MPFFALTLIATFISATRLRGTSLLRGVSRAWRDTLDDDSYSVFPIFSATAFGLTTPRALNDERLMITPRWLASACLHVEFSDIDFGDDAKGLLHFLSIAKRARVISFSRCGGNIAAALIHCPSNLTSLTLCATPFTDTDAETCVAVGIFNTLQKLCISATDAVEAIGGTMPRVLVSGLGDAGVFALCRNGSLRSLILKDFESLTDNGVTAAIRVLPSIEHLSISRCPLLSGIDWLSIITRERGTTLRSLIVPGLGSGNIVVRESFLTALNPPPLLPSLEYLDLSLMWLDEDSARVLGTVLRRSRLKELHLRSCSNLCGRVLTALRQGAGYLAWGRIRRLDVAGCGALCDNLLSEAISSCTKLESLDVSGVPSVSERSFRALASTPHLTELHFRVAVRVDGDAIRSWLAGVALLRATLLLPQLSTTAAASAAGQLSESQAAESSFDTGSEPDDDGEEHLSTLHSSGNALRDRAILTEYGIPSIPLAVLGAWRAIELDDTAVGLIAAASGIFLKKVDIEGAGIGLSDTGVVALLRSAKNLRTLSLASVPITDATLHALARDPVGLENLDISDGIELSRDALLHCCLPFGAFAKLQSIKLSNVASVNDDVIIALLNGAPSLQRICIRGTGNHDFNDGGILTHRALDALGAASLRGAIGRLKSITHLACSGAIGLNTFDVWVYFIKKWLRREDAGLVALIIGGEWRTSLACSLFTALGGGHIEVTDKKTEIFRKISKLIGVRVS